MNGVRELDDNVDASADAEIARCLDPASPKSFFLFAGAGSGKTRSLVDALRRLVEDRGRRMQLQGQQVAVITYTNAAVDEIAGRLRHNPLIRVSTIHSFLWELIKGFDGDIRKWLRKNLQAEIAELEVAQSKGRASKASVERARKIESKQRRLLQLPSIKRFSYNPSGDNREVGSLNHSEVIEMASELLQSKPLMQQLVVNRYPVIFVDESQDTNKHLVDALFAVQATHASALTLGLFGDMMQRIYSDGKENLGRQLPAAWAKPAKVMNHRCSRRVVRLINKIRLPVDGQQQQPRNDAEEGHARLFLCSSVTPDRSAIEAKARERMKGITGDNLWGDLHQTKTLILEHHMAARRMGFEAMFVPLYGDESLKTGTQDGSLPAVRIFGDQILPLIVAVRDGKQFAAMALLRKHSPLLEKALLEANPDQLAHLEQVRKSVDEVVALAGSRADVSFGEMLKVVAAHNLFAIPESLYPFSARTDRDASEEEDADEEANGREDVTQSALAAFLKTPFWQIQPYKLYVNELASFDTHQNVKGREFPRVMVIMDDEEMRGFSFSYDKLFGAKEKTKADYDNEAEGKDTSTARTRRLFYVTCSRSQKSLALVAYSSSPGTVRATAITEGWFEEKEIEILS